MSLGKEWYNASGDDDDDDEDDDVSEDIDLSDQDWRAFRAKLVMQKPDEEGEYSDDDDTTGATDTSTVLPPPDDPDSIEDLDGIGAALSTSDDVMTGDFKMTPLDPSQYWAYDSGKVIEKGAVILGGVEQDFGFGLRQQYFHKTVILVLEHDENKFTKGIILNRPTDMLLVDDNLSQSGDEKENKWRVWFGGDVQGWDSAMPDIVCLHSNLNGQNNDNNKNNDNKNNSDGNSQVVMRDIQYTSFDDAKRLVKDGHATPSDFWIFCGYAGWGPGQLMGEIERKSWYMVATDSQTLLKELARQSANADPRDAGLDTWELLMEMIGKQDVIEDSKGDFDDLMLKEWAREKLLSDNSATNSNDNNDVTGILSTREILQTNPVDRLIQRASMAARGEDVSVGSIVRASSDRRSPFLLSRQEYHKSLVVIISDDENISCGVLLNQPAARGLDVEIKVRSTGYEQKTVTVPLRYGGEYAVKGQNPLLWLHCSTTLRANNVGAPLRRDTQNKNIGIWRCSSEEATDAISKGFALPTDFMVVSGVSVWTKGEGGRARGIQGEIRKGHFEVVDHAKTQAMWDTLQQQELLTRFTLAKNLAVGRDAWNLCESNIISASDETSQPEDVLDGLGEGYDEEDDSFVYKSDVKVTELSDDALRSWVATFLLGLG